MAEASLVPPYTVRPMTEDEIPLAFKIMREIGMGEITQTLSEGFLRTWFNIDPEGFILAISNEGDVLGVSCGAAQHEDTVFIGMFGVKPKYKGKGIGIDLWKAVENHLSDDKNDEPTEFSNYMNLRNMLFQNCGFLPHTPRSNETDCLVSSIPGIEVRKLAPSDPILEELVRYNKDICGFLRNTLVSLEEGEGVAMVAVKNNAEKETKPDYAVCGYGCLKTNAENTVVVNPLYADSTDIAELLLFHMIEAFPLARKKRITLGIGIKSKEDKKIAKKLKLMEKAKVHRHHKNKATGINLNKIYLLQEASLVVF